MEFYLIVKIIFFCLRSGPFPGTSSAHGRPGLTGCGQLCSRGHDAGARGGVLGPEAPRRFLRACASRAIASHRPLGTLKRGRERQHCHREGGPVLPGPQMCPRNCIQGRLVTFGVGFPDSSHLGRRCRLRETRRSHHVLHRRHRFGRRLRGGRAGRKSINTVRAL